MRWQSPGVCPKGKLCVVSRFAVPHTLAVHVATTQKLPVAGQSALVLHRTHVPAATPAPHTPLSLSMTAHAAQKFAVSPSTVLFRFIRQLVLDTGISVGSSALVMPPAPLHAMRWQSPADC